MARVITNQFHRLYSSSKGPREKPPGLACLCVNARSISGSIRRLFTRWNRVSLWSVERFMGAVFCFCLWMWSCWQGKRLNHRYPRIEEKGKPFRLIAMMVSLPFRVLPVFRQGLGQSWGAGASTLIGPNHSSLDIRRVAINYWFYFSSLERISFLAFIFSLNDEVSFKWSRIS